MWRKTLNVTFSFAKNLSTFRKSLAPHPRVGIVSHSMSSTPDTKLEVIHDEAAQEFSIQLTSTDGVKTGKAVLQYSEIRPGYVDLEHTGVPVEFRGHGIAKILAQAAFDYFVERKIDIRPTCTYLQKFYKENPLPQYQERVKWDSSL